MVRVSAARCFVVGLAGVTFSLAASPPAVAAASATSSSTDSAFISAPSDVDAGFRGTTLTFDGSSRLFDAGNNGRPDYVDVVLEDDRNSVDISVTTLAGQTLLPGHYDDEGANGAARLGLDLGINGSGCRGRTVADISDITRNDDGTIARLAMTFSHSCGNLATVVGEVRYHEPAVGGGSLVSSPTRADYGRQTVGHSRDLPIQVRNGGTTPTTVTSATTGPFRAVSNTCGSTLLPGASCSVLTRFTPAVGGTATGSLSLRSSDGTTTTVPLSGIGRPGFTGLTMQSSSGDYVGQGRSYRYTEAVGAELTYFATSPSFIQFRAAGPNAPTTGDFWDLSVAPPSGRTFRTGDTYPVQRESFQDPAHGGLDIGGQGRGCNNVTGTVQVVDFETAPDGRPLRFDLRMTQNCDGSTRPLVAELGYSAPVIGIDGSSTRATTYGSTVSIAGTADPGSTVEIWFRSAHESVFTRRRTLVASNSGAWSTSYVATDDYRIYAANAGVQSPTILIQIAPTIAGPAVRTVRRNSTATINGTATPGATVTLHFHKAGTPASDYSILRTITAAANGTWSRPYVASTDYRYYASLPNGQVSPTVLAQSR
jgi:hypothetical protein